MYAMQKALRKKMAEGLDWLTIKSLPVSKGALPWFWNWADRKYACWWNDRGFPFVQGPNMLFTKSYRPRIDKEECGLLDAKNCRMMFCHSEWYRDLIVKHRGKENLSPIVLWQYPIDPWPGEPLPAEHDLILYAKNGNRPGLLEYLFELFPRNVQIHYGQYKREQLYEAARRSRACAYLADDDHGPLAQEEILLAGCPVVGVRTGASLVKTGITGIQLDSGRLPPGRKFVKTDEDQELLRRFVDGIRQVMVMSRKEVRALAAREFGTYGIVERVLAALESGR